MNETHSVLTICSFVQESDTRNSGLRRIAGETSAKTVDIQDQDPPLPDDEVEFVLSLPSEK
jgi:hypothetical protein